MFEGFKIKKMMYYICTQRLGEGDAEAAVAVPQRSVRLLLRQPDRARGHHEAVRNQGRQFLGR